MYIYFLRIIKNISLRELISCDSYPVNKMISKVLIKNKKIKKKFKYRNIKRLKTFSKKRSLKKKNVHIKVHIKRKKKSLKKKKEKKNLKKYKIFSKKKNLKKYNIFSKKKKVGITISKSKFFFRKKKFYSFRFKPFLILIRKKYIKKQKNDNGVYMFKANKNQ